MTGVDLRYRGKGFGGDLLVDCLRRIASAAEDIGIRVVLLDVLDCGEPAPTERRRALYASYGFAPLPSNELRMFLPISDVKALLAEFGLRSQSSHSWPSACSSKAAFYSPQENPGSPPGTMRRAYRRPKAANLGTPGQP